MLDVNALRLQPLHVWQEKERWGLALKIWWTLYVSVASRSDAFVDFRLQPINLLLQPRQRVSKYL